MSSPPPQISILFVAGAWHTDFHIAPITPHLERHGYRVVPVTLPTSTQPATGSPPPVIQDNIDLIASLIATEISSGQRVAVLGHSVSGQSCAAGLSQYLAAHPAAAPRLVHLFFTACFLDPVRTLQGAEWYSIDLDTMWSYVAPETARRVFYNDMSSDEAAAPFVRALRANRAQMPPEEGYGEGWRRVKGTYFVCGLDRAVLPERQRWEGRECGMDVVELEMDHCPMVSRPREFAEVLHGILGEC